MKCSKVEFARLLFTDKGEPNCTGSGCRRSPLAPQGLPLGMAPADSRYFGKVWRFFPDICRPGLTCALHLCGGVMVDSFSFSALDHFFLSF